MKTCRTCASELAATTEFFGVSSRAKDGLATQCRPCERQAAREYRARAPRPREQVRRQQLWTWYRLTPERWSEMLEEQDGRCANLGCRIDNPGKRGWMVDHDHSCCAGNRSCGKCVRGLLCTRCNVMLGMSRDSVSALLGGASYLMGFNNALQSALGPIGG